MSGKKKQAKKRERRERDTLPKRIAGVKVPKALRSGGAVRELAANPVVRDIVATALTAAAAAIATKSPAGAKAGSTNVPGKAAIIAAFAAAATDVVRQLREGQSAKGDAAPVDAVAVADAGADPTPHTKKPVAKPAKAEPPITH